MQLVDLPLLLLVRQRYRLVFLLQVEFEAAGPPLQLRDLPFHTGELLACVGLIGLYSSHLCLQCLDLLALLMLACFHLGKCLLVVAIGVYVLQCLFLYDSSSFRLVSQLLHTSVVLH